MQESEAKAREYAKLKKGFDREEETYYNCHTVALYDAYLAGYKEGQLNTKIDIIELSDETLIGTHFQNN